MTAPATVHPAGPRALSSGGGPQTRDHRTGEASTQIASDDRLLRNLVLDALPSLADRRLAGALVVIRALGNAFVLRRATVGRRAGE